MMNLFITNTHVFAVILWYFYQLNFSKCVTIFLKKKKKKSTFWVNCHFWVKDSFKLKINYDAEIWRPLYEGCHLFFFNKQAFDVKAHGSKNNTLKPAFIND